MTIDRINRTITLRDGRKLGYAEYGDPGGKAVFHFNSSGYSRLEHPVDESILSDLGVRSLTTDQPGQHCTWVSPDDSVDP